MRKLFAVMLVAAAITACNDNTKTEAARAADSIGVAAPQDNAPAASADSTAAADTAKPKM